METPRPEPRRIRTVEVAAGNWLKLTEVAYRDHTGRERTWEAVQRRFHRGAVVIIARLVPSGGYVLIEQYRPPADAFVLEFPAGMIDGHEPPEQTAVRELREETGLTGSVSWLSRACLTSPGMSGEAVYLAFIEIDEQAAVNHAPQTDWDDSEHIETFRVLPADLPHFLAERERAGVILDSRVTAFFRGQGMRW